ncbi:MAG: S41 family peptidase [Actinobacteria bacterium]|nr:S41 family peptidase [Actinomycetota bacterium]
MDTARSLRPFLIAILVIAAFLLGALFGKRSEQGTGLIDSITGAGNDAELTSEVLELVEEKYFEDVDAAQLERASAREIVNTLRRRYKDRFSHYFGPEAFSKFNELTEGRFSGVGMSVTEVPRGLRVANVFDGSPAKQAGIREGDLITEVDGRSIAGQASELSTGEIKGEAGTEVTLTVITPPGGEPRELELTRADLAVPAVESRMVQVGGRDVAYVRLLSFSQGAHAQLRQQVEELDEQGAEALVLDLRGNGGGLLTEAVLTSSVFIEDGVIVSTEGRSQPREELEAVGEALRERPTVVLVNGDTASASEIMTAALADAGLARIVGEKTYGKGSFQELIPLESGGGLDLTIGEYLTRDGDSINGIGIPPDVPARDRPATKPDEGLRAALRELARELGSAPASDGQ